MLEASVSVNVGVRVRFKVQVITADMRTGFLLGNMEDSNRRTVNVAHACAGKSLLLALLSLLSLLCVFLPLFFHLILFSLDSLFRPPLRSTWLSSRILSALL